MAGKAPTVERMLADIEHRVLEEVWLGRRRSLTGWALIAALVVTVMLWRVDAAGPVPTIAAVMLATASGMSALALARCRYRWCCAAAYSCGLASVFGVGAFWWARTGRPAAPLTWLMLADVAVVVLTALWLMVIGTPVARSQPDMRSGTS